MMFFEDESFSARIFQIDRFTWSACEWSVRARPFGALVLRLRGEGSFAFENGTCLTSREGDVMYLPHGVGYSVTHTDGEVLAFHFWEDAAVRTAENLTPRSTTVVTELFWEAYHLFRDGTSAARMRAVSCFYRILSAACEAPEGGLVEKTGFLRAFSALVEQFADPDLSIPGICARAGISESAFRRNFCARYGKPPVRFLTELRLREAQRRLIAGRESIECVALSCGFRDVKYFSRVVKAHFGCTPTELRSM